MQVDLGLLRNSLELGGKYVLKTKLCEILNIKYPSFRGMAWIATAELAAAVSEAGGLGIVGGSIS